MTADTHADTDPAVSVCFAVKIDPAGGNSDSGEVDLGTFISCEGLGCEVVVEQREEGGNNGFVWQLPTRLKYSNVKLTRPVGKDTTKLTAWFASLVNGMERRTATISAMNAERQVIASWSLTGVIPVRWTGPSLSVDSPKVATETLEIAHHGFLPEGA
ncbi:phage tail protein [Geodermatophilus sp. SYSU D00703]